MRDEPLHLDDWLDAVQIQMTEGEAYARLFLEVRRMPAWKQIHLAPLLIDPVFCVFRGERFRCTGGSRLGDIWLVRDFGCDHGHDLRVNIADCSDWERGGQRNP